VPIARDVTLLALLVAMVAAMAAHAHVSRGSIVGTASAAPISTDCAVGELEARVACLRRSVRTTLRSGGDLAWALRTINERARADELLAARCHMLLHEEGRAWRGRLAPGEIEHDGKDCAAGFLHGWMLTHLGRDGRLDRATVDSWCAPPATPLGRADCEHGMGHVLVRNVPGGLGAALGRCRALGGATRLRNCASGAFMENRSAGRGRDGADADDGADASSSWRRGDPWRPCRHGVPDDLLDVCAAWAVRDVAPARRLGWCRALPGGVRSRGCRVAVGVVAPSQQAGTVACRSDDACWWGRGYAWAMLIDPDPDAGAGDDTDLAIARCAATPRASARRACEHGLAFRRVATRPDGGTTPRVVEVAWA
jgi:hypothetical protein